MEITRNENKFSGFLNPVVIFSHLWGFRNLIWLMSLREIKDRYKGAFLGMGLYFLHPLIMLGVYTFVFSVIFNARWGIETSGSKAAFALILFLGLITFRLISEMINTSSELMTRNVNYVKKISFPLEILPVVRLFSIVMDALISLLVLGLGILIFQQPVYWSALLLPLIWLPVIFLSLACGYALAIVGVFFRDIKTMAGILTTFLFFSSSIFFPMSRVPAEYQIFFRINPIAVFVEYSRKAFFWGELPELNVYLVWLIASFCLWVMGFACFMKFKKAFADVI